jgi:TatD DNase family protein
MIDFHCHLDLYPEPKILIARCEREGTHVLSVTTTPSAWRGTTALSEGSKYVHAALGLHPELAHERRFELELFDQLLAETKYVGEIGLDHTRGTENRWSDQRAVLQHILASCQAAGGRILSIHSRRAATDVLNLLEAFPQAGIPVLHWFSGNYSELSKAERLGCWFSVGPAMLRGDRGRALASRMPRDRVLTESDGPFARVDQRAAEPADIELAIRELANIWGVDETEVNERLLQNFQRLVSM